MSLIEDLGGYDRASRIANCKSGVVHPTKALLDDLLEYRRQHNIFEVGDKVVFKWEIESSDIFTIYSIDAYFIGVKRFEDDDFYYANINWGLKHATESEIKAGRRL